MLFRSATLRLTVQQPRQAARLVIGWPLGLGERWTILALAAALSTLSARLVVALVPEGSDAMSALVRSSPLGFAALQLAVLALMALLIFVGGRTFGGLGRFSDGLAVLGWVQAVLFVLQLAQIAALVILPGLAEVIALASIGLTLWILPNFIAELHGFRSALATFFGILGTMAVLVVALSVLLAVVFGVEA